ncbi:long-chain-fatty-acid--CoA ligase [Lampropedia aestuarii]|uniref:long-chain-fatty-acid--CoA ligase n=1 Tax=Lampropedia aestuarii TaxID=2562762 RepID=UPI002468250B|nr:long-chain-fatty-acid--CoA ligase [Lampropedia aestuarii]MDH5859052.1 long-chain-fatty-acid--CoA ligase [Lampropedia aestuarii]
MDLQLTLILHKAAAQCPQQRALHYAGEDFSYESFTQRVAKLAQVLHQHGVGANDRVGMLALNSHRFVEFYFGTWWAGAVVNPVNIRWSAREIAYSLDDCDTQVLLVDDQFLPLLPEIRQHSRALRTVIYAGNGTAPPDLPSYEDLLAGASPAADAQRQGDDLAAIMYTGGTTGKPKGVMLSHRNLLSNALSVLIAVPRSSSAIALVCAPIFHIGGWGMVLQSLHSLSTLVMLPMFNPQTVLQAITTQRATEMFLVPTMLKMLMEHPEFAQHDMGSIATLIYGAAAIDESLLLQAMRAFTNARFYQAYGMTECAPVTSILAHEDHLPQAGQPARLRSAGRPVAISHVRIADTENQELPRGQVGELQVRGPHVMQGYWNQPAATASSLAQGWMHTGDGAYQDEAGYLYVVDRVKDMIITGGENVYSAEVENALAELPAVLMSAVIGIPDAVYGESVHAVIQLRPGHELTEEQVITHCKTLIASYKCPRSVEFRSELPLSAAGKLQKFQLRAPYWANHTRNIA